MSKSTSLRIDSEAFLQRAGLLFQSKLALFSELAQNAQRAGATSVHFLIDKDNATVECVDDGSGIGDIDHLFDKSRSYWDDPAVADQVPYGLGFLSCIANSTSFVVHTGRQRIEAISADVLSGAEVEIHEAEELQGTKIALTGVDLGALENHDLVPVSDQPKIFRPFRGVFDGFPIAVTINGYPLPRAHDLDEIFEEVPGIGHVWVRDRGAIEELRQADIYLNGQGLMNISETTSAAIHLCPQTYAAVMPDRARLTDESSDLLEQRWKEWSLSAMTDFFESTPFEELSYPAWASRYFSQLKSLNMMHLLNDLDYIPRQAIARLGSEEGYHSTHPAVDCDYYGGNGPVTRETIESTSSPVLRNGWGLSMKSHCEHDYATREHADQYYYGALRAYIINPALSDGHWIHKLCQDYQELPAVSPTVELVDDCEPLDHNFGHDEAKGTAFAAKTITLSGPMGEVKIDTPFSLMKKADGSYGFYDWEMEEYEDGRSPEQGDLAYLLPVGTRRTICSSEAEGLMEYAMDLRTEHYEFNDSYLDAQSKTFAEHWTSKLLAGAGPGAVIHHFLSAHREDLQIFAGQTISIAVDEQGAVTAG